MQRRMERGEGVFSQRNLQAGAGVRRPGNAGGRAGAGYGGVGRRQSPECPPAQPLMSGSSGYQLREGLGWGCRASWLNRPERKGGDCSLESAMENRRGWLLPLIFLTSRWHYPSYHPPYPVKMPTIPKSRNKSKGLLASLEQAGQEGPLDSCSSWAIRLAGGAHVEGGSLS